MKIDDFYSNQIFIGDKTEFVSINRERSGPRTVYSPRKARLMSALQNYFTSQGQSLTETGMANASQWMNEMYNNNNSVTDQEVLNQVAYWLINGR